VGSALRQRCILLERLSLYAQNIRVGALVSDAKILKKIHSLAFF
jgi:hypothetical protein